MLSHIASAMGTNPATPMAVAGHARGDMREGGGGGGGKMA